MTDIKLPPLPESCSDDVARKFSTWQLEAYAREAVRLNAGRPHADAGLDVEAVLRLFLTGDGFIAECDIPHIVAALTAQPAINGYTCTVPDVAGLVEALEIARADLQEWMKSFPDALHDPTVKNIERIDSALAAYRKQGGEE